MEFNWRLFLLIVTVCTTVYSQGLRRLVACPQELVQIECDSGEIIAVHDAIFYANQSEACGLLLPVNLSSLVSHEQSLLNWTDPTVRKYSVQSAFNKRCSGRSNCTILLHDDEPQSKSWANGRLYLHYSCISSKSIIHNCGETIEITSEVDGTTGNSSRPSWIPGPISVAGSGYIKSNGYPDLYRENINHQDCRWGLQVSHGRRVRLQILDLSIRSETNCTDALTIQETQTVLLNRCGELEEPLTIESQSNALNITLTVKTKFIFPKRGLLIYFTAIGCPTPEVPKHGHLVYRNESHAQFMCRVDHIFPDTGMQYRNLTCQDGHRWSSRVPDCIDVDQVDRKGNESRSPIISTIRNQSSDPKTGQLTDYNVTFDLIIPTSIIAGLILGNIIIVLAVFQCRRRRNREAKDTEESVPLQNNPGPSDTQTDQRTGTPV